MTKSIGFVCQSAVDSSEGEKKEENSVLLSLFSNQNDVDGDS